MTRRLNALILAALAALLYPSAARAQGPYDCTFIGVTKICAGSGTPEGNLTGIGGDLFLRRDGAAGTIVYTKTSGSGNTGWLEAPSAPVPPVTATYITQTANSTLTNEQATGVLASALLVNTTTTGVLSAYAGSSCTNQFVRGLSALGVSTCATVSLTADVAGILLAANGGSGLDTSASSGVPTIISGVWAVNNVLSTGSNRVLYSLSSGIASSVNFTFDPSTNRFAVNGQNHVFGSSTPNAAISTLWTGSLSGSSVFFADTTVTGGVGQTLTGLRMIPTFIEAGSGTHAYIANGYFDAPAITAGAATVTNAATVLIDGAPTGTFTNTANALRVVGRTQLDSPVFIGGVDASAFTVGVAAGYKVARGSTALDGSNPTTVATGLTTVVSCTGTLLRNSALTSGTAFLTHATASGANVDWYGWVLAGTASTGTETFEWICVGT